MLKDKHISNLVCSDNSDAQAWNHISNAQNSKRKLVSWRHYSICKADGNKSIKMLNISFHRV